MTELDKWKNEARELNAEIEKWRKENETMTELVDEMDAEIDMLRKALGTAGLTINTQSAEIERLKARNEFLEKALNDAHGRFFYVNGNNIQGMASVATRWDVAIELAAWLKEKENGQ